MLYRRQTIQPGKMRDRITLQKPVDGGIYVNPENYKDYKSLWAWANFLRGSGLFAARAANVKTDVEFVVRYRTDIKETMRIQFNGNFYNIESVLPLDNTKQYLVIGAYELKYDGV